MIEVLGQTLASPAEILIGALSLLALLGGVASWRWPRAGSAVRWGGLALALLLGLLAGAFRDHLGAALSDQVPAAVLAGALGRKHAEAARVVWWACLLASALTLTTTATPRSPRPGPWPLLGLAVAVPAAFFAPYEPALTAVVGVGWWMVAGRRGAPPAGALLLAFAAFAGADARLYHDAALFEVADVARFGPDLAAWWLSVLAAVAWLAWGLASSPWPAALVTVGAAVALLGARQQAMTRAPHPELVALSEGAPVWTPQVANRLPHGCLVRRVEGELEVRPLSRPWAEVECPDRGAFVRRRGAPSPTLAVGREEPTASLTGWYPGPGEVRVLVELAGVGMASWRRVAVPFEVWPGPVDGAFRQVAGKPGHNALLLDDGLLRGSASSGFPRVPLGSDPAGAIAAAVGDRQRVDLLLPPDEVTTVGQMLDLCATALLVRPTGLRCVVATGDWSTF